MECEVTREQAMNRQTLSDIVNLVTLPEAKKQKVSVGCSQDNQQIGAAPAQISLQNCQNITFTFNYTN